MIVKNKGTNMIILIQKSKNSVGKTATCARAVYGIRPRKRRKHVGSDAHFMGT